jgi:hypothetical protein
MDDCRQFCKRSRIAPAGMEWTEQASNANQIAIQPVPQRRCITIFL